MNAAALASLAMAPSPPTVVRFGTGRQEYDTQIGWNCGSEPDLVGYRLVWRPTHQPFWTRGLDVLADKSNDAVEAVVLDQRTVVKGLSRDDLFFAVQAVNRDGNASLPTFPVPPAIRPARANRE